MIKKQEEICLEILEINMKHFIKWLPNKQLLIVKRKELQYCHSTQILEIVTDLAFEEVKHRD